MDIDSGILASCRIGSILLLKLHQGLFGIQQGCRAIGERQGSWERSGRLSSVDAVGPEGKSRRIEPQGLGHGDMEAWRWWHAVDWNAVCAPS